jgi:hypothetical protein
MGAVFEKSATTRTGDVVLLPLGETIVALWLNAMVDASRKSMDIKLLYADTTILQLDFLHGIEICVRDPQTGRPRSETTEITCYER